MPAWKALLGELISECLAMFIIIVFGCSVAAMYTLYDPSPYQNAYWGVCIAWGLAVTIAIYVTGAVVGHPCQSGGDAWRLRYGAAFPGRRSCHTPWPRYWAGSWARRWSI